jgi:hypothetical protein
LHVMATDQNGLALGGGELDLGGHGMAEPSTNRGDSPLVINPIPA